MKEDDGGLMIFVFAALTLLSISLILASMLTIDDSIPALVVCSLLAASIYYFPEYGFGKNARLRQALKRRRW